MSRTYFIISPNNLLNSNLRRPIINMDNVTIMGRFKDVTGAAIKHNYSTDTLLFVRANSTFANLMDSVLAGTCCLSSYECSVEFTEGPKFTGDGRPYPKGFYPLKHDPKMIKSREVSHIFNWDIMVEFFERHKQKFSQSMNLEILLKQLHKIRLNRIFKEFEWMPEGYCGSSCVGGYEYYKSKSQFENLMENIVQ